MGKTILELFTKTPITELHVQNGVPVSTDGKTMQERYNVRNSKDIKVSSNSVFMNPSFLVINKLRKTGLANRTEERLIEEELVGLRPLRAVSTPILYGSNIIRLTTGTTSDVITMREANKGSAPQTGSAFTGGTTPSAYLNTVGDYVSSILGFPQPLYPTSYKEKLKLGKIDIRDYPTLLPKIKGDAAGGLLGKLLSTLSTPSQVATQGLGGAISALKSAGKGVGGNVSSLIATGSQLTTYSNIKGYPVAYSNNNTGSLKLSNDPVSADKGKQINVANLRPSIVKNIDKTDISASPYSKGKRKTINSNDVGAESLETKRGLYSFSDTLNQTGRFDWGDDIVNAAGVSKGLEDMDLVPLRFQKINDNSIVYMRALISGFSEAFTPAWEASNMLGNPFNFYSFTGIERKVSFTLRVYAMSQLELIMMWRRLEYLAHLTYPHDYTTSGVIPSLFRFTLGSMYVDKPAILTSLTYTIDDNSNLWEIGGKDTTGKVRFNSVETAKPTAWFKGPTGTFWSGHDNGEKGSKSQGGDGRERVVVAGLDGKKTIYTSSYESSYDENIENLDPVPPAFPRQPISPNDPRYKQSTIEYRTILNNGKDIDMNKYKLPKFINAQMEITFLEEQTGTDYNLYGYGQPITPGLGLEPKPPQKQEKVATPKKAETAYKSKDVAAKAYADGLAAFVAAQS